MYSLKVFHNILKCSLYDLLFAHHGLHIVFEQSVHKVAATADTPVGRLLTTVHAKDPDMDNMWGHGAKTVLYKVGKSIYLYKNLSREAPGFLKVNSLTGEVTVAQSLLTYSQGIFSVVIESADSRNSSMAQKDSTHIKVHPILVFSIL